MITEAEAKIGANWVAIDFAEGVKRRKEILRCRACGGRVTPYVGGGAKPHFMHLEKHVHCALSHDFSGTPKPHPNAVP